jgi:chemotaxis protein methyltransferase CheR
VVSNVVAAPPAPAPDSSIWAAATARLNQGDKASAEILLRKMVQHEPGHIDSLLALGRLSADRGDWDEAKQFCQQVLDRDPLSIEASFILAQIYEHQNYLDAALTAYRRTTYIDRNFVPGILGMASIWRQMGRGSEAQRTYRNLLKYLSQLDTMAVIAGTDGATVSELITFVNQQLTTLP